ncbi:MAG: Ig domain-containing protein, partial [Fimbriimonadaceae bacterium]
TSLSPLLTGTAGSPYSVVLTVADGTAPYVWTVSSGAVPGGLALGSAGVLSGTPTAAGTFNFTAQVTDNTSLVATKPFSITINTPFASWTAGVFTVAEQADSATSGLMADPNHNGVANLLEFALNRDPKAENFTPPLATGLTTDSGTGNQYLTVTYSRRIAPSGITCHVEVSSDLAVWNAGSFYTEEESVTDDGNGITQTVKVRVLTPMNQAGKVFTRLRVTQP